MCPAAKFVLNRTITVKGRISWEINSTKGRKNISPTGLPKGNKWEKNLYLLVTSALIIIGSQKKKTSTKRWNRKKTAERLLEESYQQNSLSITLNISNKHTWTRGL